MRTMTKTHAGALYSILWRFYVQTVCTLVDYSPPVLDTLNPSTQRKIKVIQNGAMRTMLGAPG